MNYKYNCHACKYRTNLLANYTRHCNSKRHIKYEQKDTKNTILNDIQIPKNTNLIKK
jgi:hypothetical protein